MVPRPTIVAYEAVFKGDRIAAATTGQAQDDFDALFDSLAADPQGALDGVHDMANMPLEDEPRPVRDDLDAVVAHRRAAAS